MTKDMATYFLGFGDDKRSGEICIELARLNTKKISAILVQIM